MKTVYRDSSIFTVEEAECTKRKPAAFSTAGRKILNLCVIVFGIGFCIITSSPGNTIKENML